MAVARHNLDVGKKHANGRCGPICRAVVDDDMGKTHEFRQILPVKVGKHSQRLLTPVMASSKCYDVKTTDESGLSTYGWFRYSRRIEP
jgi:hypothetical protein